MFWSALDIESIFDQYIFSNQGIEEVWTE